MGRVAIESKERNPLGCYALAQVGHTYLNVIDIEAGDLQEVPVREPSDEDLLPLQAEGPSSAALHHMAASVTGAAPLRRVKSPGSFSHSVIHLAYVSSLPWQPLHLGCLYSCSEMIC